MTALSAEGVAIAFGGRAILREVTIDVPDGAFIGVLGANGAGKSTLMRAALGLVPLAAGTLRVLDRPVTRGNPAVGYMPQVRTLPAGGRIRGRDFVAGVVHGHRWGLPRLDAAGRREVDWVLERVGAADLADRPLADLSGGQRQRLLLAQALIGRPRLLLLDEPLINLDPNHQHAVIALVRDLCRDLGLTVLFSAHELNPLLGAIDQVLYLAGGHAALGPVDRVVTAPVLSALYGTAIDVIRVGGRIFVMADGHAAAGDGHIHDGGDHDHDHGHGHGRHDVQL